MGSAMPNGLVVEHVRKMLFLLMIEAFDSESGGYRAARGNLVDFVSFHGTYRY